MATAVALEGLDQYEEAAAVYTAVIERWPRRLGGWIGLANAWYCLDPYRVVEESYVRRWNTILGRGKFGTI